MSADITGTRSPEGGQRQSAWDAMRDKAKRLRRAADELEQIANTLEQDIPVGSRAENDLWRLTFL